MDYTKKMALVPQNMLATLANQQTLIAPTQEYLGELDTEMKRILEDRSMPPDIKARFYNQVLHRYFGFRDHEMQQPMKIQIEEPQNVAQTAVEVQTEAPRERDHQTLYDTILTAMPKQAMNKAKLLISHLKNNPDVDWNDRQELVYKGEAVPDSNFTDLMNSFLRQTKVHTPKAQGWREFGSALLEHNAPKSAITNANLLDRVRASSSEQDREESESPVFSTPGSAKKGRRSRVFTRSHAGAETHSQPNPDIAGTSAWLPWGK